jgi:glucose/arabinose dehydrogenase
MMHIRTSAMVLTAGALLAACADQSRLPEGNFFGPDPQLPEPTKTLIPTLNAAEAVGWPQGRSPTPAPGLQVTLFADSLQNPRWLYELPNGDVLVAEAKAPEGGSPGGIKGWVAGLVMSKATSDAPNANRISLLRDVDGDGIAEVRLPFLEGLSSPFGMALVGNYLYVANADSLVRYPYESGQDVIFAAPQLVQDLTLGTLNHHWTKNLIASVDGQTLYLAIGSNSNVGENGMDEEVGRAAIWELDVATGDSRIYASGLRNPVGMTWNPVTGELWTSVNERDELGSDLVPDYMTSVREGGFYGWPWRYYGHYVDDRVDGAMPVADTEVLTPDYALGNHTASLGLTWIGESSLPAPFADGMIVGQHGSWNRNPRSGYKVIFVPFRNGVPSGDPLDVLTGFLEDDEAYGRPVGVIIDQRGGLLVADDVGGAVWRVTGR